MFRNRFGFLIAYISFDNHTTRPTRWQHDRFAAFREIFEEFNKNLFLIIIGKCEKIIEKISGKFLVPDNYLSLDQTLYQTRAQISFKQFNPSKPAKYRMLFKSINSCRYSFTFSTAVCSGKPKAGPTSFTFLKRHTQ